MGTCVAGVQIITKGSYVQTPTVSFVGGAGTDARFTPATGKCVMDGQATAVSLQIATHYDDFFAGPPVMNTPSGAPFYYNIKADPMFAARWPALPLDRVTIMENGIELLGSVLNNTTLEFTNPGCDVGISANTLYWTTAYPDAAPWDRSYLHFTQAPSTTGVAGAFSLPGDWRWWESIYQNEPFLNQAWCYINRTSRFHSSGYVQSLSVQSPLRITDMGSGIDSNQNGVPMTGQVMLSLDGAAAIFSSESPQIDLALTSRPVAIWNNNTGRNVLVSSVILASAFQQIVQGQTVPATSSAKITIGTLSGAYKDIAGFTTPVDTCLLAANQYREILPDQDRSVGLIAPGTSVYLQLSQSASSPIVSQLVTVRIKGHVM